MFYTCDLITDTNITICTPLYTSFTPTFPGISVQYFPYVYASTL